MPPRSLAVVRRPIAADHSCLFNSVGYCMHQSKSRAPFLRRVVSNEVSGDPEAWNDAFLGMPNAAYCAWINDPVNWGGGIELAILAAHYRREIAAWNIETGEPHVFGEEQGEMARCGCVWRALVVGGCRRRGMTSRCVERGVACAAGGWPARCASTFAGTCTGAPPRRLAARPPSPPPQGSPAR